MDPRQYAEIQANSQKKLAEQEAASASAGSEQAAPQA
jgi:hypothetical protein